MALPLVCRRLNGLLYSPQLVQHAGLSLKLSRHEPVCSLLSWLAVRCAGRMQQLELDLDTSEISGLAAAQLTAQLPAVLAACGAAGGLEGLLVDMSIIGSHLLPLAVGS